MRLECTVDDAAAVAARVRSAVAGIDSGEVTAILDDVRARGDAAVLEYEQRFSGNDSIVVTPSELAAALEGLDPAVRAGLETAIVNVRAVAVAGLDSESAAILPEGHTVLLREVPMRRAAVSPPGGEHPYPTSVVMGAVTARAAGVDEVAVAAPGHPVILAAAALCEVDEVFRMGGAQAVAALAYGTGTIAPVAKIVGPGNAYVAAAKRLVFGTVGIDSIAGPSEVLVIADKHNNPEWIAADLLAQAEHDTAAQSILMTDDAAFGRAVEAAVGRQLKTLPRGNIAGESWSVFGAIIELRSLDEAPALADRIAAEHLEIATADPEALSDRIRNAGAIFIGAQTPEMIGDYIAGSNHVLPTSRTARFSSGLGVLDFMKRTSLLKLDSKALAALAPAAMALARAEGLEAHRLSAEIRLKSPSGRPS